MHDTFSEYNSPKRLLLKRAVGDQALDAQMREVLVRTRRFWEAVREGGRIIRMGQTRPPVDELDAIDCQVEAQLLES